MAALFTHDVVKEAQSVGAQSLTGEIATSTDPAPAVRALPLESQENSVEATPHAIESSIRDQEVSDQVTTNGPSRDLSRSPFNKDALADASGGSDTDSSKPDGAVSKDDLAGHMRTNSIKKPISFKSVSVTKNFLAKANVPQTGARPGDKGSLTGQTNALGSTLKPRLVAKSALGGLSSRSSLGGLSGSMHSPDASKVWNKNRPPPAPVPRNYTDEELKQQYGIHMATRLGADDEGKEAKWADIDDDEDDWAPETVTWLDGTKSTVAPTDTKPADIEITHTGGQASSLDIPASLERPHLQASSQEQSPSTPAVETILSESPHPKTPLLASTKTILKPGSHALAQKSASAVAKPSEKHVPAAVGSPAPVPAKSPWATLPPVDKASPVAFVPPPPQQHPSSRLPRDLPSIDGYQQSTPLSPQEIEADDFHRFHNQPRRKELFNSQSGEFEPANDARKHYARHEQPGHRQPAVLQRSGHGPSSPAEPPAGYQNQWPRQRAGSNSSAGRRLSSGRLHESSSGKLESLRQELGSTSSAIVENEAMDQDQANSSQTPLPNGQPEPDAAAYMRETLEKARLAKQLRLQEEEQEEKARKERLRLKLAALPQAALPSPSEEVDTPKSAKSVVTKSPHLSKATQVAASPPKPPVPTAKGEVAQYGLMKVHQSQPVKGAVMAAEPQQGNRGGTEQRVTRRQTSQSDSTARATESTHKQVSSTQEIGSQPSDQARPGPVLESSPWRTSGAPSDAINGWGSSNSSNVWGPPQSKAKALGNGTFDNSGFRTIQGGAQNSRVTEPSAAFNGPGPIAPPTSQLSSHTIGRSLPPHIDRAHGVHGEISPPNSLGHSEAPEFTKSPHRNYQQLSRSDPAAHDKMSHSVGGPVRQPQAPHDVAKSQSVASGWNSLVASTLEDNQQARREWQQQQKQQNYDIKTLDRPRTPIYGKMGAVDSRRAMLGSEAPQTNLDNYSGDNLANGSIALPSQIGLSPQALNTARGSSLVPNVPGQPSATLSQRSSRFFPRNEVIERSERSNSPPPPETSSLDNGSELRSPRVNIPKVAVVKLPPSFAPSTPSQARDGSLQLSPNPFASGSRADWQSKFNTLLKVNSPHADAVAASSRAPLDQVFAHGVAAAVSLPTRSKPIVRPSFSSDKSSNPQSRKLDDDLYPQPEFGSTPTIRLPPRSHGYKQLARVQAPLKTYSTILLRDIRDTEGIPAFAASRWEQLDSFSPLRTIYVVRLSGNAIAKTISSAPSSQKFAPARGGFRDRRGHHDGVTHGRGGRRGGASYAARDGSGSLRGNPMRGAHRGGSSFAAKRNITAPAAALQ